MNYDYEQRAESLGRYIIESKSTVRATAKKFGISKSTVHKDVTQKLKHCDKSLFVQVRKILDINKEQRHIRGGNATKEKYKRQNYIKKRKKSTKRRKTFLFLLKTLYIRHSL